LAENQTRLADTEAVWIKKCKSIRGIRQLSTEPCSYEDPTQLSNVSKQVTFNLVVCSNDWQNVFWYC